MEKRITVVTTNKRKQQLQKSIEQKKQILVLWNEKIELLRMDLDLIKHEYDVRIGYLLLKDNQLDLEIIQLKNLKRLMEEGMTYEEAVAYEEDKFYSEILRMQEEAKRIEEEKEMLENIYNVSEEIAEDIKTLWKKLIRTFHPDLVQNLEEKHQREEIMKQINAAYAARDLEALQKIAVSNITPSIREMTVEDLEQALVDLENTLIRAKEEWEELKESEWYIWKIKIEKAKKTKEDVFAPLEKSLLDDITRKITIAQSLRAEVRPSAVV